MYSNLGTTKLVITCRTEEKCVKTIEKLMKDTAKERNMFDYVVLDLSNIKSIIDVPCGDFNYMSKVNLDDIEYLGLDISENAINLCNLKNNNSNINFKVFDATIEKLPYADLILIKDLFLHLSFEHINKILDNVKSSGCKYFATSRYAYGNEINRDKTSSLTARSIEITTEPFNFNYPFIFKTYYTSLHLTTKQWLKDEIIIFKMN